MRVPLFVTVALVMIGSTEPLLAHHSAAMFDPHQDVTVQGVVQSWEWTNPHSWLTVVAVDANGARTVLPLEAGSPNTLFRSGWRESSFQVGDKVTVVLHPRKDNSPGGALVKVQLADGKWMTWLPSDPAQP